MSSLTIQPFNEEMKCSRYSNQSFMISKETKKQQLSHFLLPWMEKDSFGLFHLLESMKRYSKNRKTKMFSLKTSAVLSTFGYFMSKFLGSSCQNFTGCSNWKLSKVNGCRNVSVYFWPCVGKAKMLVRGGRILEK